MENSQSLEDFIKCNLQIYKKIVSMLDDSRGWKQVISSFEQTGVVFRDDVLYRIEKSQSPSDHLLFELVCRQCPVLFFCNILRDCNLLNILSLIAKPEPLIITKEPGKECETVYVISGGELTLHCEAVGLPPPNYQWHFFNTELRDQTGPILSISECTEANLGEYYCVISHCVEGEIFTVVTETVTVDFVPIAPKFITDLPLQVTVPQNGSFTLSVEVQARPPPRYEWLFTNMIIPGQTSNELKISKVKKSDEGQYKCIVSNRSGEGTSSVTSKCCQVTVYSAPSQVSTKMALLIANQKYQHLKELKTPSNDVAMLSEQLEKLGFQVFALHNLTLVEMRNACIWFYSLLPRNAYALVYFGGHGFELGDKFCMPIESLSDMYCRQDCLCDQELIQLGAKVSPRLLIVILDMCLRVPSFENEKVHTEKTPVFEYDGSLDLIVATATSSHLNAFEELKSGRYVKHLCEHLAEDKNIVQIFNDTHREFTRYGPAQRQKPGLSINFTASYKLTDPCYNDENFLSHMKSITHLSTDLELKFNTVKPNQFLHYRYHKRYFLNSIDIVFPPELSIKNISLDINSEELNCYEWATAAEGKLVLTIHNIQRAKTQDFICATIKINDQENDFLLDYCEAEFKVPILQQCLWFERTSQ